MLPKLTVGTLLLAIGLTGCEAPPDSGGDAGPELTAEAARDALVEATHWDIAELVIETTPGPNVVLIGGITVNLKKRTYEYEYRCGGLGGHCGTMLKREGRFKFEGGRWITVAGKL
jgi:hypothetical protein